MKSLKKMIAIVIALVMFAAPAFGAYSYDAVATDATYDPTASYFTDNQGTSAYTGGAEGFEAAKGAGLWVRTGTPDSGTPADPGTGGTSGGGTTSNTAKSLDGQVKITGLEEGDVVKFYKIIGWDQNSGWVLDSDFSALEGTPAKSGTGYSSGTVVGWNNSNDPTTLKDDVLKYIAGIPAKVTTSVDANGNTSYTTQDATLGRINSTLAAEIAKIASGKNADYTENASANKEVIWGDGSDTPLPEAGLYLALVTPKTAGVTYNPIFVANDYDSTNAAGYANVQDAVLDPNVSYSDQAMAKKTTIKVKKTIENDEVKDDGTGSTDDLKSAGTEEGSTATSVDSGEVLKFKVETTIPEYNNLYTSAKFDITDTLTGLALKIQDNNKFPFTIKAGDDVISTNLGQPDASNTGHFTNSAADGNGSYVISFDKDYILGLEAATKIEITYYATITDDATKVINPTDNTVKVEFSNNPNKIDDVGTLIDRTNQYSFSIDADINGKTGKTSSELIKIGVDKDGKALTQKKTYDNGTTDIPALQGATFVLLTDKTNVNSLIGKNASDLASYSGTGASDIYENTKQGKAIVDSDGNGKLNFKGLDAGTYYLVETKAPDGFIRDTKIYTITITPTYEEKTTTEKVAGIDVTYKAETLKDYTVTIDDGENHTVTSTYEPVFDDDDAPTATQPVTDKMSFTNISNHIENDANYSEDADHSTLLVNTQGQELPSTGGMGTTLLYTFGAILVIAGGILLVSKRRAA